MAFSVFNSRFLWAFFVGLSFGATLSLVGQYAMRDYTSYRYGPNERVSGHPDCPDVGVTPPTAPPNRYEGDPRLFIPPVPAAASDGVAKVTLKAEVVATQREKVMTQRDILEYLGANRTHEELHAGEDELAQEMFKKIRILCWVMTQPSNHESRAKTVKETWGKRCNVLYFVSTQAVNGSETAIYPGKESRDILWGKTKLGFKYAYDNHYDDADWFVKADDDTYLIIENMRLLVLDKDPNTPIYYGCKFKPIVPQGYMSGGAGYVLSKEALRRFVEDSLPDPEKCKPDDKGIEDGNIGFCLQNVGVAAGDSRDQEGKVRFFPFIPHSHITGKVDNGFWYWQYIYYMHEPGIECCSDSVISFHYVDTNLMWAMEYLIYHVHAFGIHPKLSGSTIKNDVINYLNRTVTLPVKGGGTNSSETPKI